LACSLQLKKPRWVVSVAFYLYTAS
jgi:hypothetical protein